MYNMCNTKIEEYYHLQSSKQRLHQNKDLRKNHIIWICSDFEKFKKIKIYFFSSTSVILYNGKSVKVQTLIEVAQRKNILETNTFRKH